MPILFVIIDSAALTVFPTCACTIGASLFVLSALELAFLRFIVLATVRAVGGRLNNPHGLVWLHSARMAWAIRAMCSALSGGGGPP